MIDVCANESEAARLIWERVEMGVDPCTTLFVSSQPFCGYQYGIVDRYLPEEFLFEVVEPGTEPMSHPTAAAITLDSVARWLYVESMLSD